MPNIFFDNLKWMSWNLFLASISMIISFIIFKKEWWLRKNFILKLILIFSFLLYYFFLPNAPYVLTDVIHLVRQIKDYRYFRLSDSSIIVYLIPQYMCFIFLGFSMYVIAFQKLIHFLYGFEVRPIFILILKIVNPFLMAIGIFLGRYYRFNSWDIISSYEYIIVSTIKGFTNFYFFMFIIIITIVIFLGFEILSLFYKAIFKNLFNINKMGGAYNG